jgi:hypothetical protein
MQIISIAVLLCAGIFLNSTALFAQSPNQLPEDFQSGILTGSNHAYTLTAPKGWVLDDEAWADQGIHAIFYPRGASPKSDKIAYTRFFSPHRRGAEGRADADLEDFRQKNPGTKVEVHPSMKTQSGLKAVIRSTRNQRSAEWLAYIEAPTGVVLIAMVAKNPKDFPSLRQPFDDLVESCAWLTSNVNIEDQK